MTDKAERFFGMIAMNKGYISKETLSKALRFQKEQPVWKPLGEILVEYQLLTAAQVDEILAFQRNLENSVALAKSQRGARSAPLPPVKTPQYPSPLAGAPAAPMPGAPMPGPPVAGYAPPPGYVDVTRMPTPLMPPRANGRGDIVFSSGRLPAPDNPVRPYSQEQESGHGIDPSLLNDNGELELVGAVIGGCLIEKKIGEGGMGAIYKARHSTLNKHVVIKVLPPKAANTEKNRKRFLREARAAARLEHPNIVQVLNVDKSPEGLFYIVMQYIDGKNLSELIGARGSVDWREATHIILGVARGLKVAHENQVIHRDIKAENIILTRNGVAKIADFGLAKDLTSELKLTSDGAFIGTPLYMAPEIGRADKIDGRADIYSLGITYYYLLTGQQPLRPFKTLDILAAKAHDRIKDPRAIVPELPGDVVRVLGKMLTKKREDRYADAGELVQDLERLERGVEVSAGPPPLWQTEQDTAGRRPKTQPLGSPPVQDKGPHRGKLIIVIILVIIIIALLIAIAFSV